MFVDGQWDVSTLSGLEGQRFAYFAAVDDENAYAGMNEVKAMFDADGVAYASAEWDGTWSPDQLSQAANELFSQQQDANFVSWATGTIDASQGSMGGMGGMGEGHAPDMESGSGDEAGEGQGAETDEGANGEMGDMGGDMGAGQGGEMGGMGAGNAGGGMGSVAYHMASFDYAYRCIAGMEWLFQ